MNPDGKAVLRHLRNVKDSFPSVLVTARVVVASCLFLAVHTGRAQGGSPQLEIQRLSFNQVQLRWATSAVGFVVDQTDQLNVPRIWQPITEQPQLEGDKFVVTLTTSADRRYFRLRGGTLTPDGDEDDDGLLNANETAQGTSPFNADTDGDGWTDGVEVADATNPLNPNSTPRTYFVGRPPLDVVLPSLDEIGTTGTGVTIGRPPVEAVFLSVDEVGSSLGVTIGRPPVDVVFPSLDEVNSGSGVTIGRPPLEIVLPALDEIDSVLTGITLGRPPVSVRYVP